MDNDVDDLDDLFEERNSGDEDQSKENKSENVNNTGEATVVPVPVRKRIVRNPRLKFNPERLCGDRGIPVLVDHFKNVKFKGKGHEKEDLDKLLATLEHWTHRLFPSMKFFDCLRHIEKLGKKRPVQTCLRKIRLDMPILKGNFVGDDDDDDRPNQSVQSPEPEMDPFDALISQNQHDKPVRDNFSTPTPNQSVGHVLGSSYGSNLTAEQRKKMEYNRLLATERRKAKLRAVQCDLNPALEDSINHLESSRNENSLNEISYSAVSSNLSGDLFQLTSSLFVEPVAESLLPSFDKNHSSKVQTSQDISSKSTEEVVIETVTSEDNMLSDKNSRNCTEILKPIEVPTVLSTSPKSKLNDIDQLGVNNVRLINDEMQVDAKDYNEIMDLDSINLHLESVKNDVICENNDSTLSPQKLSNDLQNRCVDMKSNESDFTPLSQSILEVNRDLNSNPEIINQNFEEIPCTSKDVSTLNEDSDELKMEELMDLIDE